jgi:two-component system phosphate regulon response regulator PhoB
MSDKNSLIASETWAGTKEMPTVQPIKKRILVVDDDPDFTDLLRLLLETTHEYDVRVENDSKRGIGSALEFRPDIILMDLGMPEVDGGELASRLREKANLRKVPIVFLTGSVTKEEVSQRGGLIGGRTFLAKPVTMPELLDCLSKYLGTSPDGD